MRQSLFVSATGTSAGKTFVSRGLAAAMREAGREVVALKPMETGCEPEALDALALARACGRPEVAMAAGLYRTQVPVSPLAATLLGAVAPDFEALVGRIKALGSTGSHVLVEGAGGLLVPIDTGRDMSDLARALGFPILIVAPNRLGVLSHVLAAAEAAERRALRLAAIVLSESDPRPDASSSTNATILRQRLSVPVLAFPHCRDDDSALALAVREAKILEALGWT